jgi:hypothetical protein
MKTYIYTTIMGKVCFTTANYMETPETENISGTNNIHELDIGETNTSLHLSAVI